MERGEITKAIKSLNEALQLLDYHMGNDGSKTVIRHHSRIVKAAMKALDRRLDAMHRTVS